MSLKAYSKATEGNKALSTNFKVREFACNDGSDTVFIEDELVSILQKIRAHFGKPITINSAYRTDAYNKKVGGSTNSQHKYGRAADIVVKGITPLEVARYAQSLNAGGIGLYKTFTHVDCRGKRSRWDNRSGKQVVVKGF